MHALPPRLTKRWYAVGAALLLSLVFLQIPILVFAMTNPSTNANLISLNQDLSSRDLSGMVLSEPRGDITTSPRPGQHSVRTARVHPAPLLDGGTVLTVCPAIVGTCPYTSVQSAVSAAESGDVIKVSKGVYTGIGDSVVHIAESLTLQGGYTITNWSSSDPDAYPTVLDGEGARRVVEVQGVAATIEGFGIRNGYVSSSGGGGIRVSGDAVIRNNRIYSNTASSENGGGIYLASGSPTVEGNHIYLNVSSSSSGGGGGIYIGGGSPTVQSNYVYSNTATKNGGGIYALSGAAVVEENQVYHNSAADIGGGIFIGASVVVQYNEIYTNTASNDGGGIGVVNVSDSSTIWGNNVYSNAALSRGGGVYVEDSSPTVEENQIYGNQSDDGGGGIYIAGTGSSVVRRNTISGNDVVGTGHGGGIRILTYNLLNVTIVGNAIHDNSAASGGGIRAHIHTSEAASAYMANNLIYSNTATTGDGGGMYISDRPYFVIENNTIYGNQANGNGGGIYDTESAAGSNVISNTIIVGNEASSSAGGYYRNAGDSVLGYNDVWGNVGGNYSGVTTPTTDISQDPLFVDPSAANFRLQDSSPCIGAADPDDYPADDYDGFARPFGADADIGAHEAYLGTCFVRVGSSQIYTSVQTAVDAAGSGDEVRVAGLCEGSQGTVTIDQSLKLLGGFTKTNWITPTSAATLDAQGQDQVIVITGTGNLAVTVGELIVRNGSQAGISVATSLSPTIRNVVAYDNGDGFRLAAGGSPRLYNNTFVSNTGDGIHLIGSGFPVVSNTIVVSNSGKGIVGGSPVLAYNDVWGNGTDYDGPSPGTSDFSEDPQFVDPANGDFRLHVDSACINAGDPDTTLVWDFEGDGRPQGEGYDVGADESTAMGADVIVSKSGSGAALTGAVFTYILSVANVGNTAAAAVVLTDTLPEEMTFVTHTAPYTFEQIGQTLVWQVGDLAAEGQASFDLATTTPPTLSQITQMVNQAWATTANSYEYDSSNNTATLTTTVYPPAPEVGITPSYSELTLQHGATVTLVLTVENAGTAVVTGLIPSPPQYLDWVSVTPATELPDLWPEQSVAVTVTLAPPETEATGTYRDLVTVAKDGETLADAAFSARVVGVTRTLGVSVTDAYSPVVGASVYLIRKQGSVLWTEGVSKTIHEWANGQTDEDGLATLEGLEVGAYDYTVVATGYGAAQGVVTVTEEGSGTQQLAVELVGQPLLILDEFYPEIHVQPGEIGYVETAVRNVGSEAATNVEVTPPGSPAWIYVGLAGSTDVLTAGQSLSVTLFASPPATSTKLVIQEYVDVTADGAPATRFALTVRVGDWETGTLQLRITDPAGAPLEGARVTLVSREGTLLVTQGITRTYYDSYGGTTGAGGVVSFEGIPSGEYDYYVDAVGYDSSGTGVVLEPGETCIEEIALEPLPFVASWQVHETAITDTYAVTLTLTFEADRLQVMPVEIVAPCQDGTVTGTIGVRNVSTFTVTGVEVWGQAPGTTFSIDDGPTTIASGQAVTYTFTANVEARAYGKGWIAVSANEVPGSWAPVQVKMQGCRDGGGGGGGSGAGWSWSWGDVGPVGYYLGGSPSFGGVEPPPFDNGPTTIQLKLNQTTMLERQAFLAVLTLNDTITEVTGVTVTITARDREGLVQDTHFTITPTVPTELPDLVPGDGGLSQQWTIVPSYLAITEPTTYTLRAVLHYTMGGERWALLSLPEEIAVRPQPEVHVEYFLPHYVRAGEPVLLGMQAENQGFGTARNLRIESAYPTIVSQQGQPVGFDMLGTYVSGTLQSDDLLLDLGDIPPSSTVTGGWMLEFSYHGKLTGLGVRCEHLDYQGMELSNLLYCDGGENVFDNDLQHLNGDECPIVSAADKIGFFGGPINSRSGNYRYAATDLSIPAAGEPLRMERSYNSSNVFSDTVVFSDTDTLGPGWTHRYSMRLEFPDLSDSAFFTATTGDEALDRSTIHYRPYVIARLPGGSRVHFADDGGGTYTTYPGAQATLAAEGAGGVTTYTLSAADQTAYVFDGDGRLQVIRDRHGNETQLSYNGGGRLAQVTDPAGLRWLSFDYDGQGRLVEVRDPISRTVRYGYDGSGNLEAVTDTLDLVWTYTYTGPHLLYEVYNPAGKLVERTDYVSVTVGEKTGWRAFHQENGAGITLTLSYDENETTIAEVDREQVHRYDFFGTLTGEVDPAEQVQQSSYNWDFRRDSTTDALGRTTQMAWNACCGQLSAITDTLGNTTRMAYDASNNLTQMTDAADNTTSYEYDQANNLTVQTDALGHTVHYAYDEYGHVISTTDAMGRTTLYGYDPYGQRTVVTDAMNLVTRYDYDGVGRLITITAPTGLVMVNEYDSGDNLIRVTRNYTSEGGQNYLGMYNLVTEYGYDDVGRRVATTDTLSHVARSWYDDAGRLIRTTTNYSSAIYPDHGPDQAWNLTTWYGYDALGHQAWVTDTLSHVTYTEYDALDRVVRTWRNYLPGYGQNHQDVYNLVTEYGYDAVGNQILVTDTLSHVTRSWYDDLNRLVSTTVNYSPTVGANYGDQWNLTMRYGYDAVGNQVWVTDTLSHVTYTEYDKLNRPVTVTTNYVDGVFDQAYPDEDLVRVTTYDAAGRVLEVTDPASRITHYEYDELGRPVTVTANYVDGIYDSDHPDEDMASVTVYDDLGRVAARVQVAEEEIATTYAYDEIGRLITTTDALSGTTVTHYDALGRRIETIDAEGNATYYEYDAAGRLVTTTNALSGTVTTTYDALGRRVATTDPLGHTSIYTYNAARQLAAQADPLGNITTYNYDALSRRTVVTDADGVAVYSTYDGLGRLAATTDALGNVTQFGYDALGNRTVMTNANNIAMRYEYDNAGRLIAVTENYSLTGPTDDQTNVRTEYGYDVSGNLCVITDALSHTTVYTYDLAGRRVAEADSLGNVTGYQYDGHGRRVGEIYSDASGPITVTTTYNALGWPTHVAYPAIGDVPGFTVEYSYNALGHRGTVTDAAGSTSYDYDALYRPLGIDAPTGEAQYLYDAAGRRTNLVYPTGETVTYTHDAAGRLRTVTDWEGGVSVYTYTAAGRLSGMQLPNGVETAYGYDGAGRLVEIEHLGSAGELLARYEYVLDGAGTRVVVTETVVSPSGGGTASVPERDTLWTQNAEDRSAPIASRGHPGHAALVLRSSKTGPAERSDAVETPSGRATGMRGGREHDLSVANLANSGWLPARVQPRSGVPVASLLPRAGFLARPMQSPTSTVVITQNTTWTSDTAVGTLVVTNSATLTLTGAIAITATDITVADGASISADGQGYGTGSGPGAGDYGGGAGYGGWGGDTGYGGTGGTPYGSLYQPDDLGSGGGDHQWGTGGTGGGAIRLVVSDTLEVEGTISANGGDGGDGWRGGGGGSGGSIWIDTSIIAGTGLIRANGGDSGDGSDADSGGGGGGRTAIYADSDQFEGTVQAQGGWGYEYGGPGTIYRKGSTGLGTLLVDNGSHDSPSAGLVAGEYEFDVVELTGYGHLTVMSSTSVLTLSNDTLAGDGTARLTGEGIIAAPSAFNIVTATLVVEGDLVGPETITTANSGGLELHAYTPYHSGTYTFTRVTVGAGTTLRLVAYEDGDAVYTDDYGVELRVEHLAVSGGATLSADGQGYGTGSGPGAGDYGGGAGYGGWGGDTGYGGTGGTPYGSLYQPDDLGSGGGDHQWGTGGTGGGAIRLVVSDTLEVEGTISANGGDGGDGWRGGGGGSGGSIWIDTSIIAGTGVVCSDGGDSGDGDHDDSGGGGGGRIAIYADSDQFEGTVQAQGGWGYEYGDPGTIHLDGLLIVGFTADPLSGYAPLTVTFTNTTTGVATGYEWAFGDGATSVLTHPTHVYTAAGVYTVSLTATGSGGSDTLTRTNYVTVTSPPAVLHLEAGTVEGVSSSGYTTVTLARTYEQMVVIATAVYSDNTRPLVTRVRNAQDDSFQVKLQNPGDGYSLEAETVHYLVMDAGSYTLPDGGSIEACVFASTLTDRRGSWVGQSLDYIQAYTTPVVLGQVMSENDADWSVFWDRGTSASAAPDSDNLWVGKHVGQDTDTDRADEVLGVVVIEAGSGSVGEVAYRASVGGDSVCGIDDSPPYAYSFSPAFSSAPEVALLTQAAMDGNDGGWAVLYGVGGAPLSASGVNLAADEDQIQDGERSHTTEQVGYLVFEEALVYPAVSVSANFHGSPLSGTAPLTVTFVNDSTGATSYEWDFGDSGTSALENPTHVYTGTGAYTVSLTATGPSGSDTLTRTNYIAVSGGSGGPVTTTRVITYTYDPLNRLTNADYSTGESFAYQYDGVGNRTVMTDASGVTTYTYDAANRLTSVGGVSYTWDERGNLTNDGVFTYTYRCNDLSSGTSCGQLVRAESITQTIIYTYTSSGLRVGQNVDGVETTFVWDWAAGIPEMLSDGGNLYLVGHDTLGYWDSSEWTYHLPDALGSVRQATDDVGAVVGSREWTPFGVEVGSAQPGLGYTGEWSDFNTGLQYLRARWLAPRTGRFTQKDPWEGDRYQPQTFSSAYVYVVNNPINKTDPSGQTYNWQAARTYALNHWAGPSYGDGFYFDYSGGSSGGDCTNFVSQALWAGGLRDPRSPEEAAASGIRYWHQNVARLDIDCNPNSTSCDPIDPGCIWRPFCNDPDADNTWVWTPDLHDFLTEVLHFPEITYESVPHINGANDTDAFDMNWITFLTQRGSTIRPGDVVFYRQSASQFADVAPWTHAALVVGWGMQTYFPDGNPVPVSSAAPPPVLWSCIGTQKPLVVEHSGASFSQSPDNKQPRSIDNTGSPAERISIVLMRGSLMPYYGP